MWYCPLHGAGPLRARGAAMKPLKLCHKTLRLVGLGANARPAPSHTAHTAAPHTHGPHTHGPLAQMLAGSSKLLRTVSSTVAAGLPPAPFSGPVSAMASERG